MVPIFKGHMEQSCSDEPAQARHLWTSSTSVESITFSGVHELGVYQCSSLGAVVPPGCPSLSVGIAGDF